MDWENPLRSIAATVDADVLKALAEADTGLTGNELAKRADRSYAQVYAVVRRMVGEGIVLSSRYGRTNVYDLNREHVLVHGILRVLASPSRLESEVRRIAMEWDPPADTIAWVGSAARRATAPHEEIRILIVPPRGVEVRDRAWRTQVDDLLDRIGELSGNPVNLTEATAVEITLTAGVEGPLVEALRGGARSIFGADLRSLASRAQRS